ncbi:DUF1031 family protein [Lactococcus taiwanensis]|uniref:DUF1031 family protein n=1 Tax=Lactococcus taiwanensis TaxID=1151742 RepID=UPI00351961A0
MKDFSFLILAKLFNLAKTEVYNRNGDEFVFISGRCSGHEEIQMSYEEICELYHQGKPMTYQKLFDFLKAKEKNSRVVL